MTRAGLAAATANIPMGGFKFTGLGPGSASTDSINFSQLAAFAPLAGAAFAGAVSFGSTISVTGTATFGAAAFSGATTVPTVSTGDSSTNAASTALVTAKIAAQAAKTPQVTVLTTGTAATYTTPTVGGQLAAYLEITDMLGAGGGGAGSGSGPGVGTAGGDTTFGPLTAHGGAATPANTSTTYPTPATATGGDTNISGALGGAPSVLNLSAANNGGQAAYGASSPLGTGGSPGTINSAAATISSQAGSGFGAGGGAGGNGSTGATYNSGWGGNAGGYTKTIIASPAATYTYTVGAAGTGGVAGTSGGAGGNGSGGYIRVVAHFQ